MVQKCGVYPPVWGEIGKLYWSTVYFQVVEPRCVFTPVHRYSSVDIGELSSEAITKQAESYIAGLIEEFREKNYGGVVFLASCGH